MIDSFYPYTSEFKLETIQTVHSQDLGLCAHDGRNSFATWLMQKENDRILQALAIDRKMAYDLARPAFGVLLPFEDGWCITDENEPQKVDMLVTCIDSVLERDSIDLAIGHPTTLAALGRCFRTKPDIFWVLTFEFMPLWE